MKITLLTYGSRGDIQPFLALADGLQRAGHSVLLALPGAMANLAGEYNIPTLPLPGDPTILSDQLNRSGHNFVRQMLSIQSYVLPLALEVGQLAYEACQDCDLVVHSFLFASGAHTFARQRGIPDVSVQCFPVFAPTSSFAAVAFPEISLPGPLQRAYRLATHRIGNALFHNLNASGYPVMRRKRPAWPKKLLWPFDSFPGHPPSPLLMAVSPSVLPRAPEWEGSHVHVTGYLYLDEPDFQPSAELQGFLESGDAPVCIGFGSMIHPRAEIIQRTLLSILRREGQRAVILTGWDGWQEVRQEFQDSIFFYLESAPHAWLLPRCKLSIHHGGAGTTAAALRAGIPQWIIPFTADQPFWASRVHQAGVAARPLKPEQVQEETAAPILSGALQDAGLQARAAAMGEKIRAEDGVGRAVEVITRHGSNKQ